MNNCERDLHRRCRSAYDCHLLPYDIPITLLDPEDSSKVVQETLETLAPYEVFAALFQAGPQFGHALLGRHRNAGGFWRQVAASGIEHHVNDDMNFAPHRDFIIPTYWHSDGGDVYKDTEYSIYSWTSSLVHDVDTLDSKFLVCLVEQSRKVPGVTDAELVRFIAWNLRVMGSGLHPSRDHLDQPMTGKRAGLSNKPLAAGWRAAFYGWQGDTKEKVKVHGFSRNWMSNFICEFCLGCRHLSEGNAYDFAEGSMWQRYLISHDQYMLATHPAAQSPWTQVQSWRIDRNLDDLLHMIYLGFGKDVAAQLIFESACEFESVQEGLVMLTKECRKFYKDRKISFNTKVFTMSMLSLSTHADMPTLETKMKGAQTKMIFLWISHRVVAHYHDGKVTGTHAAMRAEMAWCLSNVIHIFDEGEEFLTIEQADEVYDSGFKFLRLWSHMASAALAMGITAYKVCIHKRSLHRCQNCHPPPTTPTHRCVHSLAMCIKYVCCCVSHVTCHAFSPPVPPRRSDRSCITSATCCCTPGKPGRIHAVGICSAARIMWAR